MKYYLIKINSVQYEVEVEEIRHNSSVTSGTMPITHTQAVSTSPENNKIPVTPSALSATQVPSSNKQRYPRRVFKITAPMPGNILSMNVNTDDSVLKDQVLLILETMKMENEILAPAAGKIASVNVSKGAFVNVGDVLVSISNGTT